MLRGREVVLLADRGFAHRDLLGWAKGAPDWHYRIYGKRDLRRYRWGGKGYRRLALRLSAGNRSVTLYLPLPEPTTRRGAGFGRRQTALQAAAG